MVLLKQQEENTEEKKRKEYNKVHLEPRIEGYLLIVSNLLPKGGDKGSKYFLDWFSPFNSLSAY